MNFLKTLLLAACLFAGGTYTFSQPSSLPIGNPDVVAEYFDAIIDDLVLEIDWMDDATGKTGIFFHDGMGGLGSYDANTAAMSNWLKTQLDKLPAKVSDPSKMSLLVKASAWYRGNLIYQRPVTPYFHLVKDGSGNWIVPAKEYEVGWVIKESNFLPLPFFTTPTRVRIAVQFEDNGILSQVYDSKTDENKPASQRKVLLYPINLHKDQTNLFHVRANLAWSGFPGLITVSWTNSFGEEKTTLYSLQTGEKLDALKVRVNPPPGEGPVAITVAVNPERHQVVEVSDNVASGYWTQIGYVDKTAFGQVIIPYQVQGAFRFYRTRWISDLEATAIKQQSVKH